ASLAGAAGAGDFAAEVLRRDGEAGVLFDADAGVGNRAAPAERQDVAIPRIHRLAGIVGVGQYAHADQAARFFAVRLFKIFHDVAREVMPLADAVRAAGRHDHLDAAAARARDHGADRRLV